MSLAGRPDWVKERVVDEDAERRQIEQRNERPNKGFSRREKRQTAERPVERAVTTRPVRGTRKKEKKERPIEVGSVSLGEVEVVVDSDKAIMVVGGETEGENWIPRSVILDGDPGVLSRDAKVGDIAELWVPSWLADKIPW